MDKDIKPSMTRIQMVEMLSRWEVGRFNLLRSAVKEITSLDFVESQDFYRVRLTKVGEKKISIIQVLRKLTGSTLGLAEAKEAVESVGPTTPFTIVNGVTRSESQTIKAAFESYGASIDITPSNVSDADLTPPP